MADPAAPRSDRALRWSLIVLTATAGCIDAASYLGLGQVFTANMTGNVVLLGFGLAGAADLPIVAPLLSLGGFVVGAAVGGRITRAYGGQHPRMFGTALAGEVALIALAAVVAAATDATGESGAKHAVIVLLAVAMGVRTALALALAVPELRTTVVTLTIAGMAADARLTGGSGRGTLTRFAATAAMAGGALVGALLERADVAAPLLAAVLAGLLVLALYPRARRRVHAGPERPHGS